MAGDFPDPWWQPDDADRRRLADEVLREVPMQGHPLSGQKLTVVARCAACDEVLVRLSDDSFALVHPAWAGRRESPPWPKAVLTGGFIATEIAVDRHAADHGISAATRPRTGTRHDRGQDHAAKEGGGVLVVAGG